MAEQPITRVSAAYSALEDLSDAFLIPKATGKENYKNQYATVYYMRLALLGPKVLAQARLKWRDEIKGRQAEHTERILDVKKGSLTYIIGTVYSEMKLKPNVLDDIATGQNLPTLPERSKYCSEHDEMMLEDESGRIRLVGNRIKSGQFTMVTGVIAAVLGAETSAGDFEVIDVCFAGLPEQKAIPKAPSSKDQEWVAIVSGLELGASEAMVDYSTVMLTEWLTGEAGEEEDRELAKSVAHLILAGNSMAQPLKTEEAEKRPKRYGYDSSLYSAKPTDQLDAFLTEVLTSMDVDVLTGDKDPTSATMPQQPLHPGLLVEAGKFEGFNCRSNPAWLKVGDATILGTSGQTIDDIFKYTEKKDRLTMAKFSLEWAHIAPTAPDTLFCYPFQDRDPFIIAQTPHIYFIGNQPEFETCLITGDNKQKTRIVLVPKFTEKRQLVLVNTRTLEVKCINFAPGFE